MKTCAVTALLATFFSLLLSACGSVLTYGEEYGSLSELEKYFIGPWHQHGDINFSKPYAKLSFKFEDWKELETLCGTNNPSWQTTHKRKHYGDAGLLGEIPVRPMGCYIETMEGYETPVILWIEGRDDIFLHELAHHYGVIDEDS